GPMARSAEDAAIVLGAIAGADASDPTALAAPVPDYLALAPEVRGVRIGVDDASFARVAPEVEGAVRGAVRELERLGGRAFAVRLPPSEALARGFVAYCAPEAALAHAETFPSRAAEYGPNMRAFLDVGRMITGMQRAEVDFASRQFSGALAALFERVDLIAVPVVSAIGMTLDRIAALAGDADSFAEFLRFTAPFDFS